MLEGPWEIWGAVTCHIPNPEVENQNIVGYIF